ncbi:putative Linear gramicidin synthase subunit C [Streptomyces alboflavus]|uniref:Putative Linear gramicidin synthase subunit C n=1 Tax=Streptomyces alboflavus TaxID=67267 RepID=A0A1Z1WSN4_9ACTN|nr:putative Linear gramicidin synthase subunit C [Streptomyces alboflavus]
MRKGSRTRPAATGGVAPTEAPLTPIQRWYLDGRRPGDPLRFTMTQRPELAPGTDLSALGEAVDAVVRRHAALRTGSAARATTAGVRKSCRNPRTGSSRTTT